MRPGEYADTAEEAGLALEATLGRALARAAAQTLTRAAALEIEAGPRSTPGDALARALDDAMPEESARQTGVILRRPRGQVSGQRG